MARSSVAINDALNQAAVSFIEQGLKEQKTVGQILEALRREPSFERFGMTRLQRTWAQVWRPMVAQAGRAPLPRRGGGQRPRPSASRAEGARPSVEPGHAAPVHKQHLPALERMVDAISALLENAQDKTARDAALQAFPGFVRAVRAAGEAK